MKNFDIEQLERKNIYRETEPDFAAMQQKVLEQTVHRIQPVEGSSISKNTGNLSSKWWYAVAAAIAVIFGITFFMNGDNDTPEQVKPQVALVAQPQELPLAQQASTEETDEIQPAESTATTVQNADLTSQAVYSQTVTKSARAAVAPAAAVQKSIKSTLSTEKKVEALLEDFNPEDIDQLAQNTGQDIYLDLYN